MSESNPQQSSTKGCGKNLAFMQQRLLEKQQQNQPQQQDVSHDTTKETISQHHSSDTSSNVTGHADTKIPPGAAVTQVNPVVNRPGKSADQLLAAHARMQQKQQHPETSGEDGNVSIAPTNTSTQVPLGRPKGKDIAQMLKAPFASDAAANLLPNSVVAKPRGKDIASLLQSASPSTEDTLPRRTGDSQIPNRGTAATISEHGLGGSVAVGPMSHMLPTNLASATNRSGNLAIPPNAPVASMNPNFAATGRPLVDHNPGVPISTTTSTTAALLAGTLLTQPNQVHSISGLMQSSAPVTCKPKPNRTRTSKPTKIDGNLLLRESALPANSLLSRTMKEPAVTLNKNMIPTTSTNLPGTSRQPNESQQQQQQQQQQQPLQPLLGPKLSALLASLDPSGTYILQEEAEEHILHLVNDFLHNVVKQSMRLAKHRCGDTASVVDVTDVALALKKGWGMVVPGFSDSILSEFNASPFDETSLYGSGPASRALSSGPMFLNTTEKSVWSTGDVRRNNKRKSDDRDDGKNLPV